MLLLEESETFADQPHSAPFSSENEAQGGDSAGWQCITPSTSPSGETLSHPSAQPPSRPSSRPESQTPSRSLSETKKRSHSHSNKPAHMRRNIRKLLREHQLEVVTKAAQQEELERRERLEQQRKEGHFPVPLLPEYTPGDLSQSLSASVAERDHVICLDTIYSSTNVSEDDSKALITEAHAPKEDVIELSSDEDDALQISSESTNEVENRSAATGAHTNDAVNQPDAQGRVLVNLNHPAEEADVFLSSHLARAVKPHQIGGIRFLYDNLIESLERYGSSSGFGCILAHSMGLGKTLQVISFIDIVLRHTQAHTVLAIVPVNTLQNWLAEFNLWLPTSEALPVDVDPTQVSPRTFKVHILNDEHKTMTTRAKVISDWSRDGGVLLMGYEMYRLLSLKKSFVAGRKKSKKAQGPVVIDLDEEDRHQELLKGIEKALSRPGPDVVICDEGHRIKNCHASTSQALKNIHTRRRVVLTGYPLQNNLIEYWCMVDFVRPDFLGTRQEFSNMFERPILNGQCVDSTPQDVQLMRYRSHVLHSLLEGFVQRRGHDVLRDQLPSKDEHVILVRLSPLQRALYTEFMNRFREAGNSGWLSLNPLKAFCVCCKIWNHTDVLYEALQKENLANEQDLELDDITNSHARCPAPNQKGKTPEDPNSIGGLSLNALQERANQVITYEWAKEIMSDYKPGVLENSAKMVLLFHLIDESVRKGDKILVFSQSLSTLSVIEEFLAKRPIPAGSARDGHNQNWLRNHNYYRLDGSTSASERERLINQFNDPSNTSTLVFLLSTRAGCLGVNLIGANRVVVFDASWNPCHDAQAVCRVYRYGQKKPCHIYRLVCDFTLEKKIYDRQISKQGMSDRVVDDLNPMLSFTRREVESLLHFVEEEPDVSQVQLQPHQEMEASIRQACQLYPHLVTKQPFHHESLLIDRQEMKLTKAEKKAAKKSYEDEKRASVPYTRPSYAHYYPASDQSLTNIPAFSQRNWRPPPRQDEKPVASDRPVQSTPVPMMPRQASHASTPTADSDSSSGFPVNYLQKAGVFVQKIVTTTDIVIPGTNSSTDVKARISAGESIHVIRGTKGTYIRTCDGRIFAIRAASKLKAGEENSAVAPKDTQKASEEASTNGTSGCVTRPLSPDSPEILSELQRYTAAAGNKIQQQQASKAPSAGVLETALAESTNGSSMTSHAKPWRHTAAQPNTDSTAALDLKATKRKASTPSADEWANNKQLAPGKCTSAPLPPQALPFAGGYGFPPMGLNPAMMGSIEQPLFMGAGSPYFQPHSQLGDPCLMFPMTSDPFGLGDGTLPSSSSRSSSSTTTSSFSASSDSASLAPFMLGAGMAGMLPPGFPMSYGQSVGMYPSSLLPGGLPAATPGPAGSSFLSHFPSSGLMGAGLGRSDTHGSAENAGSSSDSKNDDDDVIEVMEQ
ncbi:helicase ARIP4-like isoform X2 [Coregonus clupeaformis]|uniref:helicase ARIP4-like isoform X2 n=1 Tax=Coregonus clupeaformis TaxID=59861 RepID=UPI001E1C998D|nr:helicase ARIP4-like isoform X2 [Coregonus clupeaformis]